MQSTTNWIGIDVSKLTFDVSFEESGSYKHYRFSNDHQGFNDFLGKMTLVNAHVIMEASGPYYLRLATCLYENGIGISVVNPLVIRRFCQMKLSRAKTDKKDAQMIAMYGRSEQPGSWVPDADYVLELRQMQAAVEGFDKSRTSMIRQREAFKHSTSISKATVKALDRSIVYMEKQIARLEAEMIELTEMHHKNMFKNLQTIPGIGKKTAMQLIVACGAFNRFTNAKQLSAYFGLSPRLYESGTSVKGRSRITKMGMSRIRSTLYMCSWSAKRCNQACKELYDRLVTKGKSKRAALVAVANKLIKQAFAIATQNVIYQPNYQKNICF